MPNTNENLKKLGERLKSYRKEAGLSQEGVFAKMAKVDKQWSGFSHSSLSKWEHGERRPKRGFLACFAQTFALPRPAEDALMQLAGYAKSEDDEPDIIIKLDEIRRQNDEMRRQNDVIIEGISEILARLGVDGTASEPPDADRSPETPAADRVRPTYAPQQPAGFKKCLGIAFHRTEGGLRRAAKSRSRPSSRRCKTPRGARTP